MTSSEDTSFPRLVSLACHDLRTPLATVHGFASTLAARDVSDPKRYLTIMAEATGQLAELLDTLALAARIEGGRYEPALQEVDSLELARAAAEQVGSERASVVGEGATVTVDREPAERARSDLAVCALRHGGVPHVEIRVSGSDVVVAPLKPGAARVILGEELRDFPAAVAPKVVEALGGSVEVDAETLRVRLPRG